MLRPCRVGRVPQNYTGVWIPMLRRAVAAGVVFEAHAACGSSDPHDPVEQTKLAAFPANLPARRLW